MLAAAALAEVISLTVGAGVVTTRLIGPEVTMYVEVNRLPIIALGASLLEHRLGHFCDFMVVIQRLTVHRIYICKSKHK